MGFSELKKISEQIQRIEGMGRSLAQFENQLRAINIGIEAWVPLNHPTHTQLGWKKIKPSPWRFYCKTALGKEQPLLECPMDVHYAALQQMQPLVDALEAKARAQLDTLNRTLPAVRAIVEAL